LTSGATVSRQVAAALAIIATLSSAGVVVGSFIARPFTGTTTRPGTGTTGRPFAGITSRP
jgi:hypothetical protein